MKFIEFINILNEARFRKPVLMFHGTSSTHLRSILKNGILPTPDQKVWTDDPEARMHAFSRESFPGSYWASNLMTAYSAAQNATRKFGGNIIIVMATIAEQSAFADEDSITFAINLALSETFNDLFGSGVAGEFLPRIIALEYYSGDEEKKNEIIEKYAYHFHKESAINPEQHPIDLNFMKQFFESLILRNLSYVRRDEQKSLGYKDLYLERLRELEDSPEIPTVEEAESNFNRMRELATRKYKKTVYPQPERILGTLRTLRIEYPVTYRGSNRIISIIELNQSELIDTTDPETGETKKEWVYYPHVLHYGTSLPEKFLEQYRNNIGKFPGLVTSDGKEIMPSERKP
jgi:hypothetical protein